MMNMLWAAMHKECRLVCIFTAMVTADILCSVLLGKDTQINFLGRSGRAKPLRLRHRRKLPHKPSNLPVLNTPERAVVVLCADKIDFRGARVTVDGYKLSSRKKEFRNAEQ
jgi:hypothetical protein